MVIFQEGVHPPPRREGVPSRLTDRRGVPPPEAGAGGPRRYFFFRFFEPGGGTPPENFFWVFGGGIFSDLVHVTCARILRVDIVKNSTLVFSS